MRSRVHVSLKVAPLFKKTNKKALWQNIFAFISKVYIFIAISNE